jgi:hypothetical protein
MPRGADMWALPVGPLELSQLLSLLYAVSIYVPTHRYCNRDSGPSELLSGTL